MASQKIGALWLRKSGSGMKFMSGELQDIRGKIRIVVFENKKEKENQPDFTIMLSEDREEGGQKEKGYAKQSRSAFDSFEEESEALDDTGEEIDIDDLNQGGQNLDPEEIPF